MKAVLPGRARVKDACASSGSGLEWAFPDAFERRDAISKTPDHVI
jgi:hypothetical protein